MGRLQSFFAVICVVAFSLSPFFMAEGLGRDHSLPHVSPAMERPEFWVHKLQNPTGILLTPEQILKMNNENLDRPGSYLCRVKDLKDEWTREEVVSLLQEDWQGFGETSEVQFGRDGRPLSQSFWKKLKENIDEVAIKERNRPRFGLIVKRTDIRVFPTDEPSLHSPASVEFDRFQHSMISPGSLVGIFHLSKDRHWAYLQAPFIRGWVPIDALGIAGDKKIAVDYEDAKERLMITGSFVTILRDPSLQQEAFVAQMGSSFPIIHPPGKDEPAYVVQIPSRERDGLLSLQKGYVSKVKDVHPGLLPFTQANVAIQAFKMLRQPYGWGEMSGGRDCSRLIMDVFATVGIRMPRNSMLQAQVGIEQAQVEGKTIQEKKTVLDRVLPLVTTLRLPGHIMLYLGKHRGRYYAIHSIWGFQKKSRSGPVLERVGEVVVSDLSLGEEGLNGSLLERITDIRTVGPPD